MNAGDELSVKINAMRRRINIHNYKKRDSADTYQAGQTIMLGFKYYGPICRTAASNGAGFRALPGGGGAAGTGGISCVYTQQFGFNYSWPMHAQRFGSSVTQLDTASEHVERHDAIFV